MTSHDEMFGRKGERRHDDAGPERAQRYFDARSDGFVWHDDGHGTFADRHGRTLLDNCFFDIQHKAADRPHHFDARKTGYKIFAGASWIDGLYRHHILPDAAKLPPLRARNYCGKNTARDHRKLQHGYCDVAPFHQKRAATGIIIIRRSRANEPSQPKNSNSSVAFMCASGGACCRWTNQIPILRRRQRLRTNVCSERNCLEQMFQRRNSAALSKLYGPTSPRSIWRSAWACPNATRSRSCGVSGASRPRHCTCSTARCSTDSVPDRGNMGRRLIPALGTSVVTRMRCGHGSTSIRVSLSNTREASGTAATMAPSGLACRHPHADRRTLRSGSARWLEYKPARVEPGGEAEHSSRLIFFNTLARPVVAAPRPASSCVRGSSPGSWRGNARCCWRAEAQQRAGIQSTESLWGRAARSARQVHILQVVSSNLTPATNSQRGVA